MQVDSDGICCQAKDDDVYFVRHSSLLQNTYWSIMYVL